VSTTELVSIVTAAAAAGGVLVALWQVQKTSRVLQHERKTRELLESQVGILREPLELDNKQAQEEGGSGPRTEGADLGRAGNLVS
jgi:hypothetical protein